MIGLQSGEEKIGERIGWSVDKVQKTVTLCSRIPPQILVLAKTFQKGRGGCFPPNGGINDHSANTFDFTEGWFRNSGLYELAEENQMVFMKWFTEEQKCKVAPKNERGVTACSRIGAEILFLAKNFQAGRAPDFGANAPKNERSVTRSKIGTQILILAKTFQSGRVPEFGTNVPKNERYITFTHWRGDSDFGQNFSIGSRAKLWRERAKK